MLTILEYAPDSNIVAFCHHVSSGDVAWERCLVSNHDLRAGQGVREEFEDMQVVGSTFRKAEKKLA